MAHHQSRVTLNNTTDWFYKQFTGSWSRSCENTHCSFVKNNYQIRSQFCTCYYSSPVMTCAKLWSERVIGIKINAKSIPTSYSYEPIHQSVPEIIGWHSVNFIIYENSICTLQNLNIAYKSMTTKQPCKSMAWTSSANYSHNRSYDKWQKSLLVNKSMTVFILSVTYLSDKVAWNLWPQLFHICKVNKHMISSILFHYMVDWNYDVS